MSFPTNIARRIAAAARRFTAFFAAPDRSHPHGWDQAYDDQLLRDEELLCDFHDDIPARFRHKA